MENRLTLHEHEVPRSFSVGTVAIVLFAAFISSVNADEITEEKKKADEFFLTNHKDKCMAISHPYDLTPKVHLLVATSEELNTFLKARGVTKKVVQVEVSTTDGHRYFIVRKDSSSYRCNLGTPVSGPVVSVEPQAATIFDLGPCCTSTTGGDAQAQWFNLTNCPLYKPVKKEDYVCGH